MIRHSIPIATASLLLGAAALAGGQEVPLEFQESADLEGAAPYGSAFLPLKEDLPPGEWWKVPESTGERPLYGLAKLGDSNFLLSLDSAEGSEKYDRVLFDQNGNRDLTDDEVIRGEWMSFDDDDGYFIVTFEDAIQLDYELDGESFPYALSFQVSGTTQREIEFPEDFEVPEGFEMPSAVNIILMNACCYSGEVTLGERKYELRLGDSNCNGRFDEAVSIHDDERIRIGSGQLYPQGDHLYLTHGKEFTYQDMLYLGDHLLLGEHLYSVDVDILEGALELTEVTEGLLPLKLSYAPLKAMAHTKGFEHSIMMIDCGDEVRLPAGEYRMLQYTLLAEGEDGDVWRLAAGATAKTPFVDLDGNGGSSMKFGEPFVAAAEVSSWAREMLEAADEDEELEVYIEFNIRGVAEEAISDLSLVSGTPTSIQMSRKDSKRPLEPTYTIVKTDGELLKKGSFEYG